MCKNYYFGIPIIYYACALTGYSGVYLSMNSRFKHFWKCFGSSSSNAKNIVPDIIINVTCNTKNTWLNNFNTIYSYLYYK